MRIRTKSAVAAAGAALAASFVVAVPSAYAATPARVGAAPAASPGGTVTPFHVPDCSGHGHGSDTHGQRRTIHKTTVAHTDERAASPVKFKVPSHSLVHIYYPDYETRNWWVISYSTRWAKHCGWMWHTRILWNESN